MVKKSQFAFIFLAVLLSACAPVATSTSAPAAPTGEETPLEPIAEPTNTLEPVDIKVGILPLASYAPLYFAQAEGYFTEQALNVELVPFPVGPEILVALIQGDIDVNGYSLDIAILKAIAEGAGVRIVADKGFFDPNGCTNAALMARGDVLDSGQLDDLSNILNLVVQGNKSVAINSYAFDLLLEPVGLSVDDLQLVDIPVPNRLDAFQNGAIDISVIGEPGITRITNAGAARIWIPYEDLLPGVQTGLLAFGPTLTQENREAGNRFMLAYLKGVRLYNEGKTDRNVELMAEFTQLDPEEARQMCWQSFTSDGSINADGMIDFQEWGVGKGLIDAVVPVEEFWDGSFLEFANQALEE